MKTEDQIAYDKELVAKMIGSKSAMEAALRRIELLEQRLGRQVVFLGVLNSAIGTSLHAQFTAKDSYTVRPIHKMIAAYIAEGKEVL